MADSRSSLWMVSRFNSVRGPFSSDEVLDLIVTGRLAPHDFVSKFIEGQKENWQLISQVGAFSGIVARKKPSPEEIIFCPISDSGIAAPKLPPKPAPPPRREGSILKSLEEGGMEFEACLFQTVRRPEDIAGGPTRAVMGANTSHSYDSVPLGSDSFWTSSFLKFAVGGIGATAVVVMLSIKWLGDELSPRGSNESAGVQSTTSSTERGAASVLPPTTLGKKSNYIRQEPRQLPSREVGVQLPSHLNRNANMGVEPQIVDSPEIQDMGANTEGFNQPEGDESKRLIDRGLRKRYRRGRYPGSDGMVMGSEDQQMGDANAPLEEGLPEDSESVPYPQEQSEPERYYTE